MVSTQYSPQKKSVLAAGALSLLWIAFFGRIFSTEPFLHLEMIFHAVYWNDPSSGFLETLFNPYRMDQALGRFRYLEYLSEAAYWKSVYSGILPTAPYDYLSLAITLLMSWLIFRLAQRQGHSLFFTSLLTLLFLFSVHSLMVVVWHYRKAKVLTSLFLLLLAYTSQSSLNKGSKVFVAFLMVGGVLCDPYFILLSPVLIGALYFSNRIQNQSLMKWAAGGWFLGLGCAALLNGVIGPLFNENCALYLSHIPNKPSHLLNLHNIAYTINVLPDILGFFNNEGWYRGLCVLIFMALVLVVLKTHASRTQLPFVASFVVALPIAAFLVLPESGKTHFSTHYGHPIFLFFVLAMMELGSYFKRSSRPLIAHSVSFLVLACIIAHFVGTSKVYLFWRDTHFIHPSGVGKYLADYESIRNIASQLKNPHSVHVLSRELLPRAKFKYTHMYGGESLDQRHTALAFLMIPILFHQEFQAGRLAYEKKQ